MVLRSTSFTGQLENIYFIFIPINKVEHNLLMFTRKFKANYCSKLILTFAKELSPFIVFESK